MVSSYCAELFVGAHMNYEKADETFQRENGKVFRVDLFCRTDRFCRYAGLTVRFVRRDYSALIVT